MPALTPPDPGKVPFKKILKQFERIFDWQKRNRPIYGGLLEQRPNGFIVRRPDSAGTEYVPPFHPTLATSTSSVKALTIGTGWFHCPHKTLANTDYEIVNHFQYAFKPMIAGVFIDYADAPPTVNCPHAATTYIYLRVRLKNTTTLIGSDVVGSTTGAGGIADSQAPATTVDDFTPADSETGVHGHTASTASHNHSVTTRLNNLTYYADTDADGDSNVVAGFVTSASELDDTELIKYLPFGKIVLDADGNETTDSAWYVHNDYNFYPPTYVESGTTGSAGVNPTVGP